MSKALILFFITFNAFAENHMLFLGGGSEPQELETTIFDDEVKLMGTFLEKNKKNWNAKVSFNGGHTKTEEYLRDGVEKVAGANKPFTEQNFIALLEEYEQKIDSGQIKSGDQLLIYITTHGAQKTEKEQTHKIGMSGKGATDLNTLEGADLVSMDQLQVLITKAEQKGIKLGVMDFSCHSGASLALKNPNTCIITASGPNHFGYASWGERFARNMWKGKNLEEIFLETFVDRYETAFPMISTNAGVAIQNQFYELLTPYLHYWKPKVHHQKLSTFLEDQVTKNKCEEADANFEQLAKLTSDMEAVFKKNKDEFRDFKKAITDYHNFQNKMKDDLKKFDINALKSKSEKVCVDYAESDDDLVIQSCTTYTMENLLNMNYENLKKFYREKAAKDPKEAAWSAASIQKLEKAEALKDKLLAENPGFLQYQTYYKSFPELEKKSWDMALKVSTELQKIYPILYKEKAKADPAPNPCKNFVI